MKKGYYILENSHGQAVRTLDCQNSSLIVIYRHDTRRVEIVPHTLELEANNIKFDLVANSTRAQIEKSPLKLSNGGIIRFTQEINELSPSVEYTEESDKSYKEALRWAGIIHLSILLVVFITAKVFHWVAENNEPVVVKVYKQSPAKTVEMSETKIIKTAKTKIANKTTKKKTRNLVKSKNPTRNAKKSVVTKSKSISKIGALGVLGNLTPNASKSAKNIGQIRANNRGGAAGLSHQGQGAKQVLGKALYATNSGGNSRGQGAGGYATKGQGGGQPGYGSMSFIGSSSAYFQPLEEEASILGGLDRDQIASVINRNIGQIVYCYEKGLQKDPRLAGRVNMDFVINSGGRVSTTQVASSSLKSAQVEKCIQSRLRSWKFPKPAGNVNVKVSYPFLLKRVGQG